MSNGSVRCTVDLDQNEAGFIILLLDHVEPCDAGFLDTMASVFDCGLPELRN
jgi:hypothetical protein